MQSFRSSPAMDWSICYAIGALCSSRSCMVMAHPGLCDELPINAKHRSSANVHGTTSLRRVRLSICRTVPMSRPTSRMRWRRSVGRSDVIGKVSRLDLRTATLRHQSVMRLCRVIRPEMPNSSIHERLSSLRTRPVRNRNVAINPAFLHAVSILRMPVRLAPNSLHLVVW
jgi:hypothetical protein